MRRVIAVVLGLLTAVSVTPAASAAADSCTVNPNGFLNFDQFQACLRDRPGSETIKVNIVNGSSGKVWDVRGNSLDFRAQIQIFVPNGGFNQQWTVVRLGDFIGFRAVHSSLCADVRGASTSNEAVFQQFGCTFNANQQFGLVRRNNDGMSEIRPRHSSLCADVRGGADQPNRTPIQQFTCNGTRAQAWGFKVLN